MHYDEITDKNIKDILDYMSDLSIDPIISELRMNIYNNNINKLSYPNVDIYQHIPGAHDVQKWIKTVQTLRYREKHGMSRKDALLELTSSWNTMEVYDFLNWLKFYEGNNHLKYKTAQYYYGNADIGYLLPIKNDNSPKNIDFSKNTEDELPVNEKKRIIENQRHKIISRLDSAEKLLRSNEGQLFADKELLSLLESIYELKKKIQLINKKSTSTKLYSDIIAKYGNILNNNGFIKAANVLYKIADNIALNSPQTTLPMTPVGYPGATYGVAPGSPTPSLSQNQPNPYLMPKDNNSIDFEDELEVEDNELIVEAQDALSVPNQNIATKDIVPKDITNKEVTPQNIDQLKSKLNDKNIKEYVKPELDIDRVFSDALSSITISDVIKKFEEISEFYRTRKIPRQLAVVDMMLDQLGLAPFFPGLSEATNKALEANNYISSRIEDILIKLRGTLKETDMPSIEENKELPPEVEKAKNILKNEEEKENNRKQLRKEIENKNLEDKAKESPEVETGELGNTPAEVTNEMPTSPIKPPTEVPVEEPVVEPKPTIKPTVKPPQVTTP